MPVAEIHDTIENSFDEVWLVQNDSGKTDGRQSLCLTCNLQRILHHNSRNTILFFYDNLL